MNDGYEAEAVRSAFRFAVRAAAADGITKSAGSGYSQRVAEYAQAWMPLASAICENTRRLDEHLEIVRRLHAQDQAVKAKAAQMFDVSLGRAPRDDVPFDGRFELRTELVDLEKGSAP